MSEDIDIMIALIVAYADNYVIGYRGRIPWSIEGERTRFRELTTGNVVIMGRRTYEEIGHPLPNRTTIVVSTTGNFTGDGLLMARSLEEALTLAGNHDVYISGGAALYKEALSLADKLYITRIEGCYEGDTYFPKPDEGAYAISIDERVEGEVSYTYMTYTRK